MQSEKTREENMWKLLAAHGIHSIEELDEAMKDLKPINISCMASKLKSNSIDLSKVNLQEGN